MMPEKIITLLGVLLAPGGEELVEERLRVQAPEILRRETQLRRALGPHADDGLYRGRRHRR